MQCDHLWFLEEASKAFRSLGLDISPALLRNHSMHPIAQPILESQSRPNSATPQLPRALLLCGKDLSSEDHKLREVLDFFGILWRAVAAEEVARIVALPTGADVSKYCILSSAPRMAQAMQGVTDSLGALPCWMNEASSVYIYGFEDTDPCSNLLRFLTGNAQAKIRKLDTRHAFMSIADDFPEMCGPMSGMRVSVELTAGEPVFGIADRGEGFQSIISTNDGQVFLRATCRRVPFYLNACGNAVNISSSTEKYFDVKKHFCSAVPITMYLKWAFHDECWSGLETSACLIVDDPPLKPRYGFLHFRETSDLMDEHNFKTTIAFIPWNWRRTDRDTVGLFRRRPDRFSLAVHGCDHTASEFAARSTAMLDRRIKTARQRMDSLAERTSLQYDRVMVFPQGAFSPETGRALKLNGFVAAVNTEVAPWGNDGNETKIRDLWDVAIMKYGTFPIFTRRYPSHGMENFAFDALLGKPCLIAAHHDVFKGHGRDLVDFVARLNSLKWNLCWRPLGDAINHSFRVRSRAGGRIVIRMFSGNLVIENSTAEPQEAAFMKEESDPDFVEAVMVDDNAIDFSCEEGYLRFRVRLFPEETVGIRVTYFDKEDVVPGSENGGIGYRIKARVRRYLSEFRDNYLSQSDFLYGNVVRIKQRLGIEKGGS